MQKAKEQGIASVHLKVITSNARAQSLYKHFGFDTLTQDDKYIYMKKQL